MPDKHGNFYQHAAWIKLRRQVRIENNFICSRCGKQAFGRQLHTHHRKPFASAPGLGLEKLNLKLLCRSCHNIEHGRGPVGCDVDGTPLDPAHPWNQGRTPEK
jgi:5-methylcytosine-specific restriction endonuclease McrA